MSRTWLTKGCNGQHKRSPQQNKIRPKRERELIERLAGNTRATPRASVSAIWRELMAINLQAILNVDEVLSGQIFPPDILGSLALSTGLYVALYVVLSWFIFTYKEI